MSKQKPRILCQDDDPAILEIIRQTLDLCGLEVRVTSSPEEVLEDSGKGYDLIMVERGAGGEGGAALCRRLRQTGWRGPALLLSSRNPKADERRVLDELGVGFMVKPFGPRDLLYRVRQAMVEELWQESA